MRRTVGRAGAIVVLLVTALGSPSPALSAVTGTEEAPPYFGWTSALPPVPVGYEPSSEDICAAGRTRCVDRVISEMARRNDGQLRSCDHDAVFALLYLRTTEEYRRYIGGAHNFQDVGFENHLDAVFADYYFRAYDSWHARRADLVPPAWRVAFAAADSRSVAGTGNLLMGMNAHINRDLPFVFEALGMAAPDGSSRKPDHDTVNEFLNRVTPKATPEVARRLDPSVDDGSLAFTYGDEIAALGVVQSWREQAWRNAERLMQAPTPQARTLVAQDIERYAGAVAQGIAASYAYGRPAGEPNNQQRDAFCSAYRYAT